MVVAGIFDLIEILFVSSVAGTTWRLGFQGLTPLVIMGGWDQVLISGTFFRAPREAVSRQDRSPGISGRRGQGSLKGQAVIMKTKFWWDSLKVQASKAFCKTKSSSSQIWAVWG